MRSSSKNVTALLQVLRWAPTNHVVASMDSPSAASSWRTRGSLAICAKARAFGPPRPPPHAPQSWADS